MKWLKPLGPLLSGQKHLAKSTPPRLIGENFIQSTVFVHIIMVSSKAYQYTVTLSGISLIFYLLKDCTSLDRPINAKVNGKYGKVFESRQGHPLVVGLPKCFEIRKNIKDILDTVTVYRYAFDITIMSFWKHCF